MQECNSVKSEHRSTEREKERKNNRIRNNEPRETETETKKDNGRQCHIDGGQVSKFCVEIVARI